MRSEATFLKEMGLRRDYDGPEKLRFVSSWAERPDLIPPEYIYAYVPLSDALAHLLCARPERCVDARPSEALSCYYLQSSWRPIEQSELPTDHDPVFRSLLSAFADPNPAVREHYWRKSAELQRDCVIRTTDKWSFKDVNFLLHTSDEQQRPLLLYLHVRWFLCHTLYLRQSWPLSVVRNRTTGEDETHL